MAARATIRAFDETSDEQVLQDIADRAMSQIGKLADQFPEGQRGKGKELQKPRGGSGRRSRVVGSFQGACGR